MRLTAKNLLSQIDSLPISQAVARGLRIAEAQGASGTVNWCRLELGGYWASNPAMNDEIVVPEYRTVVGQHADIYGRVLILEPELAFVGETRLRNGIDELEMLTQTRDTVTVHDPRMCDLIRQHLHIDVYSFRFSAVHLVGILTAIRERLRESLSTLADFPESNSAHSEDTRDDILELKPNLYGIGIDLRAMWRRWKGTEGRKG